MVLSFENKTPPTEQNFAFAVSTLKLTSEEQPLNAPMPIFLTVDGMTIVSKVAQSSNAESAIDVTVSPSGLSSGISSSVSEWFFRDINTQVPSPLDSKINPLVFAFEFDARKSFLAKQKLFLY